MAAGMVSDRSAIDQLGGDQGEHEDGGGQHAGSDEDEARVEGAGVGFEDADEGGAEEAAEVAGAVDESDASGRGRSTKERCGQRPEQGDGSDDSHDGQVNADHGEDGVAAATGAEDEADGGNEAG